MLAAYVQPAMLAVPRPASAVFFNAMIVTAVLRCVLPAGARVCLVALPRTALSNCLE